MTSNTVGLPPNEAALLDLCELAWGVIANAGGGDWSKETKEWVGAAEGFREEYHAQLARVAKIKDPARR